MNRFQQQKRLLVCLPLLSALLLATGCRGPWSKDWKVADMFDVDVTPWSHDEDAVEAPSRLVGTWTDTVLHQTGKQPQRGFGGRLIFYGEDAEKPVLVDGQLVIYAFDETNREPTDNKPTRRYVFPPDQMARRMSKTELGPSYSFWLPWDEVGGPQIEISLIARFEPQGGAIVIGEQTRHLLPGESTPAPIAGSTPPKLPAGIPMRPAAPNLASLAEQAQAAAAGNQVRLASYDAPAAESQQQHPAAPERRMVTTSISLPENFRVHGGGSPATLPADNLVPAGNVLAQPQSLPPNYGVVAAPINSPAVNMVQGAPQTARPVQQMQQMPAVYPGYMTPQQSPLGSGFVAPLGQPHFAPQQSPASVSPINTPPTAPLTTASGWATVSYPPAAGAAGSATVLPQPSFGSPPNILPAPATPAFR
jgi:hypothetical protein